MNLFDLIITPFFLFLVIGVLNQYASNNIKDPFLKQHFLLLFLTKFFGAIAFAIIFQYFYGGGDTFNYYMNSTNIYRAFQHDFMTGLRIVFAESGDHSVDNGMFTQYMFFFRDPGSFFVARVGGFISFFCGNSYATISLFFSLISFTGVWALFNVFVFEFPHLKKKLAIGLLYLPSMIFWGSGYMKDPLCIAAIGWLVYGIHTIFFKNKRIAFGIILILLAGFVLQVVKLYILLALLPCLIIWILLYYQKKLKLGALSVLVFPFFMAIGILGGAYGIQKVAEGNEKYDLENIVETTKVTGHYLKRISEEGSTYSLSTPFDGSVGSLLRLAPEALIISLFRPFVWEAKNPFMLLSALENLLILLLVIRGLSIYIGKRNQIDKSFRKEYFLTFCVSFVVLFGVSIGISTFNFGALVRYKIPFLPFLTLALLIINYSFSEFNKYKKKLFIKKLLAIRLRQAATEVNTGGPT